MPDKDIKHVIGVIIEKQVLILGPDVALSCVRKIPNLKVSDDGKVEEISGDENAVLQEVIAGFSALSGDITKNIVSALL